MLILATGITDLLSGDLTPTALIGAIIFLAGLVYRHNEKEIETVRDENGDLKKQAEILIYANTKFADSLEKVIPFIEELTFERRQRQQRD